MDRRFVIGALPGVMLTSSALAAGRDSAIDRYIHDQMAQRHIAGLSLGIAHDGDLTFSRGYGYADIASKHPARPDTRYAAASLTKMFTAMGIAILAGQEKLKFDDTVGSYLDGLPAAWRRVTLRQLLTHTSGIRSFTEAETPLCASQPAVVSADVLAEVACLPLDFAPGTDWAYSDTNYLLLGLVIERVSGQAYETFLKAQIFTRLGMTATTLLRTLDDRATGYEWRDGMHHLAAIMDPLIELSSGGLVTTMADLARFDAALASGSIVPRETLLLMWQPAGIGTARYGMGFAVRPIGGRPQAGHSGGAPGTCNLFARFESVGVTVILLSNTSQPPFTSQEIVAGLLPLLNPSAS